MKEEFILGISCFFHDSAACLINTKGEIIGAIAEHGGESGSKSVSEMVSYSN